MTSTTQQSASATLYNPGGGSAVFLVCEHASNHIPSDYGDLGLTAEQRSSHIAWDPGAEIVARHLADALDAPLLAGTVSRLIYDCNRPPDAPDAIPAQSEVHVIPGNTHLSAQDRLMRVETVYRPFERALTRALGTYNVRTLVTIHSFTPVFRGQDRAVQLGVLHGTDARLADQILALAPSHTHLETARNAPYGPQDGVTHTLDQHGPANDFLNVMLELRSDLIETPAQQRGMASMLANLLTAAIAAVDKPARAGA